MPTIDQRWSAHYNQGHDFTLISHYEITNFLSHTDPIEQGTALDIGCGTGQLTRELNHRGFKVVGIDASKSAIEIAKSLTTLPKTKLDYYHLDVEQDDISILPSASFDLITCKLVYAFIQDKPGFLDKISGLLAPNGSFVVIIPRPEVVPPEKKAIIACKEALDLLDDRLKCVANYTEKSSIIVVCGQKGRIPPSARKCYTELYMQTNIDLDTLRKLEESLWIPATRFNKKHMDGILATDFFEFGRSGRVYDRDTSLNASFQEFSTTLPLANFTLHSISEDVMLITYISEAEFNGEIERANRSSIWLKTSKGWLLKFHQGTPLE